MKNPIPLVLVAVLLLTGCSGETQEPQAVLLEWQSPNVTPLPDNLYSESVEVGPEGKMVPLDIRWSSGRDEDSCLRIAEIEVVRTGGDPSVVVSDVDHSFMPCGMEWEAADTTRFETALIKLSYETRAGMRSYQYDGTLATIRGDGVLGE